MAFQKVCEVFDKIYEEGDWICSGGCKKGADRYAEMLAEIEGIPILIFYPNKKKYGIPAAYFIRNGDVAKNSHIIIACVMHPEDGITKVLSREKGGTENTLQSFVFKYGKNISNIYLV
jgi:hypothetical protein